MAHVHAFSDNLPEPDKCESKWGNVSCPNAPEFLIVTLSRPGFAIMCRLHKEGFESVQRGRDYRVEPYSLGRAKQLQAQVNAEYTK